MKTFLLVAAGVIVGLLVAFKIAVWLIKRKLKSVFGDLGETLKNMAEAAADMPQFELTLSHAEDAAWHQPAGVAAATDLLTGAGFVSAGRFLPNGSTTIVLGLFHHPQHHIAAVLYDTEEMPEPRMDVGSHHGAGRWAFFTNVKHDGLDKPEDTTYSRHPDLGNAALLTRAVAELPTEGRQDLSAEALPDLIIDCYNREQIWRATRGGYTDAELRHSIEAGGHEATPEVMTMSRDMLDGVLRDGLEEKLREAFLSTTTLSAAEWSTADENLAILHPMSDAESVVDHLESLHRWDEEDEDEDDAPRVRMRAAVEAALATETPTAVFTRFAADAPRANELKHLGHLDAPASADFFALPPWEDSDE